MSFYLTDEQWVHCASLIEKLGGYQATDTVRDELQSNISRIFLQPKSKAHVVEALTRAARATREMIASLDYLLEAERMDSCNSEFCAASFVKQREAGFSRLSKLLSRYEDGFVEDRGSLTSDRGGNKKGRPVDTAVVSLCKVFLRMARHESWIVKDSRGRTSPALLDVIFELAVCARLAGATHGRDRRAISRAMKQALKEQETEDREWAWLHKELDALGSPAP